jgi:probable selenium-dependent hydroxylase accessory protein YqeC
MAPEHSAFDPLRLARGDCVSCIGGGGKTSTLAALVRELTARGEKVVLTTTTRIWVPNEIPLLLIGDTAVDTDHIRRLLTQGPALALGAGVSDTGKVIGLDVDRVCALRNLAVVLVEADGSAGRSLKVHAPHEPVIPPCSTHVLVVAGVDAVGRPVDEDTVHRLPDFERRFGIRRGEEISPQLVATVLIAAAAAAPPGAGIIYVLNKADSGGRVATAEVVRAELRRIAGDVPVLLTAHGKRLAAK